MNPPGSNVCGDKHFYPAGSKPLKPFSTLLLGDITGEQAAADVELQDSLIAVVDQLEDQLVVLADPQQTKDEKAGKKAEFLADPVRYVLQARVEELYRQN